MNNLLMTQAEFARHRGVQPSAVTNWKNAKLLVFAEDPARPGKLLVDVQLTEARLNARIDPTRGRPTSGQATAAQLPLPPAGAAPDADGLAEVRMDLIRQQTIAKKLDNAKRAGELVPLSEYERRSSELGRLARERMHSVVRSLCERLAAERDPRQITILLTDEIDRTFAELADEVKSGAAAAGDAEEIDEAAEAEILAAVDAALAGDADELAEAG